MYRKTYRAIKSFTQPTITRSFDTALFMTEETVPNNYKIYTSLSELLLDFPDDTSEVNKAGKIFFSSQLTGDVFSKKFLVANTNVPATSGSYTSLDVSVDNFVPITDGSFKINVDGIEYSIVGLDFQFVDSAEDIADVIQQQLPNATVMQGVGDDIVFTSPTTGSSSIVLAPTINDTGTDVSVFLAGGTVVRGVDEETLSATYTKLRSVENLDFFIITLSNIIAQDTAKKDQIENLILLVESITEYGQLLYIESDDPTILNSTITTDLASFCKTNETIFCNVTYRDTDKGDEYISVGLASLTLSYVIGSYTLYFKVIPTSTTTSLSLEDTDTPIQNGMEKNANFYLIESKRNAYKMASSGRENWDIDGGGAIIYIDSVIEDALLNALQSNNKITADSTGIGLIKSLLNASFTSFVNDGLIKNLNGRDLYTFTVELEEPDIINITTVYVYAKSVIQITNNYYLPTTSSEYDQIEANRSLSNNITI